MSKSHKRSQSKTEHVPKYVRQPVSITMSKCIPDPPFRWTKASKSLGIPKGYCEKDILWKQHLPLDDLKADDAVDLSETTGHKTKYVRQPVSFTMSKCTPSPPFRWTKASKSLGISKGYCEKEILLKQPLLLGEEETGDKRLSRDTYSLRRGQPEFKKEDSIFKSRDQLSPERSKSQDGLAEARLKFKKKKVKQVARITLFGKAQEKGLREEEKEEMKEEFKEAIEDTFDRQVPIDIVPVVLPENEEEEQMVVPTQKIDVAEIICSYVRLEKNILEHCTTLGDSLAKNLIRIAATRIFANPYQSILELPVNSIDSYASMAGKKSSIGKFGMGFFSILCWVFDHNATIKIHSTFQSKQAGNITYDIIIYQGENGRIECTAQLLEPEDHTGSSVSLIFDEEHKPTTDMFDLFKQQLDKLVDITTANIVLLNSRVDPATSSNINNNVLPTSKENLVLIEMAPNFIKVEDKAQGIPYKVVFNSLLVPSSSTKTINRSIKDTTQLVDQTRVVRNNSEKSILMITVNDVVVVKLSVDNVVIPLTFVISMKPSTAIPVSRDDVILKGDAAIEFEEKCERLVKQSVEKFKDVSSFFKVLRAYSLQSNQKDLYTLASRVFRKIDSEWFKVGIFVKERSPVFDVLRKMFPEISFITHSNPNMYDSELKLLDIFYKRPNNFLENVFPTRGVFILDDTNSIVSTEGLTSLVFVSKNILDAYPTDWKLAVTQSVHDTVILTDDVPKEVIEEYLKVKKFHIDADDKVLKLLDYVNKHYEILRNEVQLELSRFTNTYKREDFRKFGMIPDKVKGQQVSVLPEILYRQYIQVEMCTKKIFNVSVQEQAKFFNFFTNFLLALFCAKIPIDDIVLLCKMLYSKISVSSWLQSYGMNLPIFHLKSIYPYDFLKIFSYKWEEIEKPKNSHIKSVMKENQLLDERQVNTFLESQYRLSLYCISNLPSIYPNDNIEPFLGNMIQDISTWCYLKFLIPVLKQADPNEIFFIVIFNMFLCYGNLVPNNFFKTKIEISTTTLNKALDLLSIKFDKSNVIAYNHKFFYSTDYKITNYILDVCMPVKIALEQYQIYKNMMARNEIIKPPSSLSGPHHKFSIKKLIAYIFSKEINANNLSQTLQHISDFKYNDDIFGLQVVDIAVNEGTTKDFIKSVLTETIQNSIDAIRVTKAVNRDIKVEINANYLSISDFVGIPNKGIISLLIPFLSTKDATQAEVTGEMGTGFFNIYRQPFTASVEISTCLGGNITKIIAVPTVENQRVTNIIYNIKQDVDPTCVSGTTIKVYFNKVDEGVLINSLSDAIVYVDKFLSYISNDFKIYLNNERINDKPKELLYQSNILTVYYAPYNKVSTSIMMTNNIPFTELENFYSLLDDQKPLNNNLKTNLIINISKEYYTPVHSRSKVNISGKMLTVLQELDHVLFLSLMHRYVHVSNIRDSIIENSQSQSELAQLQFHSFLKLKSQEEILTLPCETLDDMLYVITYIIDNIYDIQHFKSKKRKSINVNTEDIKYFMKGFLKLAKEKSKWDPIIIDVLKIWFSNKTGDSGQNKGDDDGEEEEGESVIASPTKSEILTTLLKLVYDLSKDKVHEVGNTVLSFTNPPTVLFGTFPITTLGFFDDVKNQVQINRGVYDQKYIENTLKNMKAGTIFDFDLMMNKLFAINFVKAGTFVHETSHSWRRNDKNGAHASVDIQIMNEPPQNYTFDKAASCVYAEAVKNGLYNLLKEQL